MQIDPMAEWQRITGVYSSMYDDELINLAGDANDLTDVARQVLDLELKKRGLGNLSNPGTARTPPEPRVERRAALLGNQGGAPQIVLHYKARRDSEAPLEYTWKTLLCECDSREQAQFLCESLQRAGIESWIDGPEAGIRHNGAEIAHPRVMVAADQLEQARAIAASPIPEEVLEESKTAVPEFEMPRCPHCGAKDPALEGVDPFNSWRCEACGGQWAESDEEKGDEAGEANENAL